MIQPADLVLGAVLAFRLVNGLPPSVDRTHLPIDDEP